MAVDASGISATSAMRADVTAAIKRASSTTGANFQYLLATAKMESNFTPNASATTSSARGLYQFIDQTWLGTVKEAGPQLGYSQYADAITRDGSGGYEVADPAARRAILKLRDDPVASSAMAGALTQSNSFKLTGAIGRRPSDSELYMAHFMGVGGASKLINATADTPAASGAAMFPKAAAANRTIFYEKDGSARSVAGVYSVLTSRYDNAADAQATRSAMGVSSVTTVASLDSASALGLTFSGTDVAAAKPLSASATVQADPMFRTLFQAGPRSEPVAAAVRNLWGNGASLTALSLPTSGQPAVRAPQPLDLFSDRHGTFAS